MMAVMLASCTVSAKSDQSSEEKTAQATAKVSSGDVVTLTNATFISKVFDYENNATEWKYKGDKPCIIDFYADWCGPCKKIAPVLKELAQQYNGQLIVYKINVDNEKALASAFGIQSIPTLLFVPVKGTPQIAQGALSKEQLEGVINDFLLTNQEE